MLGSHKVYELNHFLLAVYS